MCAGTRAPRTRQVVWKPRGIVDYPFDEAATEFSAERLSEAMVNIDESMQILNKPNDTKQGFTMGDLDDYLKAQYVQGREDYKPRSPEEIASEMPPPDPEDIDDMPHLDNSEDDKNMIPVEITQDTIDDECDHEADVLH